MSTPAAAVAAPAYNPWPHALLGFFGLLFLALGGVLWIAFRQPGELVSQNYYDQEMRYQGRMEARQRTQALDHQVTVQQEPGRLILGLPRNQASLNPKGTVHLFRPSDAHLDREIKLAIDSTGRQFIDTHGLQPGLWRVRLEWTADGQTYYQETPFVH